MTALKTYFLNKLTSREFASLMLRPSSGFDDILPAVRNIVDEVQNDGDEALRRFTHTFDGVKLLDLRVRPEEFETAEKNVPPKTIEALRLASRHIRTFHETQKPKSLEVSPIRGVLCRREWRPISPVGLYVPGGITPLVSTLLMLGIPARDIQ